MVKSIYYGDELMSEMSAKEFNRLYLGEFKPDPILNECVAFLRYATPSEVTEYKRSGIFSAKNIREAKLIIERQEDKNY